VPLPHKRDPDRRVEASAVGDDLFEASWSLGDLRMLPVRDATGTGRVVNGD
jgi:hypothetical protein